jgi:hypothetical protein
MPNSLQEQKLSRVGSPLSLLVGQVLGAPRTSSQILKLAFQNEFGRQGFQVQNMLPMDFCSSLRLRLDPQKHCSPIAIGGVHFTSHLCVHARQSANDESEHCCC